MASFSSKITELVTTMNVNVKTTPTCRGTAVSCDHALCDSWFCCECSNAALSVSLIKSLQTSFARSQ